MKKQPSAAANRRKHTKAVIKWQPGLWQASAEMATKRCSSKSALVAWRRRWRLNVAGAPLRIALVVKLSAWQRHQ